MKSVLLNYLDNIMPHMEGWCSREKADALVKRVQADKPDFIVEIGVFAGRSLLAMALAAHVNGNGKVLGIDPWSIDASTQGFAPEDPNHNWWSNVVNHDYIYDRCVQFMKELGLKERVILCKGTSEHSLPGLLAAKEITGGPFIGMLHVDGNHSEGCSTFDVENYVPLVVPGGHVVFDDVNWETTKKAQTMLDDLCDFEEFVEEEGQKCAFYRRKLA
jgi:predicted O-methyltransferase YrrM